jgi:Ca-activated chloride channel homolog
MRIEDMKPENRLIAAKDVMTKFVRKRVSDRIGLVVFAGEAFTACPPTLDYEILLKALAEVLPEQIKQGTAIGVGLATAVARLKESTAKSRVIVLLTDGENNSGTIDPATATDIAKGYGIKVYTIGIGQNGQAQLPIETVDAFGRKVKHYQPIHSSVNDELLTQIAESTGGKYYRAVDTDALRGVFSDIDRLEKTKIQTNQFTRYSEFFQQWLKWAVLLYVCQFVAAQTVLRRAP